MLQFISYIFEFPVNSPSSNIPWVAVGAIVAAIIAATIAFITMVVTKENSVSQFRQNWINELREDIAIFISSINLLDDLKEEEQQQQQQRYSDFKSADLKSEEKKHKNDLKYNIHEKYMNIDMKLSGKDIYDRILKELIKIIYEDFLNKNSNPSKEYMNLLNANLLILLKNEWIRVKNGEKWFSRSKTIVPSALIALGLINIVLLNPFDHSPLIIFSGIFLIIFLFGMVCHKIIIYTREENHTYTKDYIENIIKKLKDLNHNEIISKLSDKKTLEKYSNKI
ncbi:hypothetical protein [Acinetobacter boissieri]|uniref:Uncharacterized protein n=1 Tax=Acinetobacter boissieri TaxID=1219383 RepID=A0A1G6H141_9GAMM|nr:hypothetical protein [Acinetobacter boissieri]SDB87106.1 hypothetical protein SAMN05421733_10339 [Acinetobacter boissieri]